MAEIKSPGLACSPLLDASFSFRKESVTGNAEEEPGPLDQELAVVLEELRARHPDCDRLGEINTIVAYCRAKLKEGLEQQRTPQNKEAYMEKIVQLGLEKQQLEDPGPSQQLIRAHGHNFVLQPTRGRHNPCCEVCMCTIWRLLQSWRRCTSCGYRAHDKCASEVKRLCAAVPASRRDFHLVLSISNQKGLDAQGYACAECREPIMFGSLNMEPRLCDYTGLLFCPNCHWGDSWTIPARIVNNMDPTPRSVCRAVKQLLSIVDSRPLIDISQASPALFKYHKDLRRIQKMRKDFLFMKCYFISCHNAKKLRILQYLNQHQHFVENADMYSLRELRLLCQGDLLRDLNDIHSVFRKHIEEECETCRGNGFFCELCDDPAKKNELIFPFTDSVAICQQCVAVFHQKCFELHSFHCPRCERRKKRAPAVQFTDDENYL